MAPISPQSTRSKAIDFLPSTRMKTLKNFHIEICKSVSNKFNPKGSFHKFMVLPPKIRRQIYKYALDFEGQLGRVMSAHGTVSDITAKRQPFHLPAVCLTSKTECKIATAKFLRHAKFVLCCAWCGEQTLSFLDRVPGDFARASVRSLIYDHYKHGESKNDDSFSTYVMERLLQLKSLQIIMSVWDIIELKGTVKSGLYRPFTAQEILEKKNFRGVLNGTALKYIHFLVIKAGELHRDDVMEGFYTIGVEMFNAFKKRGKHDIRLKLTHYHRDDPRNDPRYSERAASAAVAAAAAAATLQGVNGS